MASMLCTQQYTLSMGLLLSQRRVWVLPSGRRTRTTTQRLGGAVPPSAAASASAASFSSSAGSGSSSPLSCCFSAASSCSFLASALFSSSFLCFSASAAARAAARFWSAVSASWYSASCAARSASRAILASASVLPPPCCSHCRCLSSASWATDRGTMPVRCAAATPAPLAAAMSLPLGAPAAPLLLPALELPAPELAAAAWSAARCRASYLCFCCALWSAEGAACAEVVLGATTGLLLRAAAACATWACLLPIA
mmetsp:Transcript_32587/g.82789  ORF Transcript_32587/g.82789 Transcript_32587/m.82789 type:complete len:255 (-) Transcript_32587:560-1324(-)